MKISTLLMGGFSLVSASAFAQSSVTLYGILDTGVEYVSHADAAGDHVVRMPGITEPVLSPRLLPDKTRPA
jgi:predicted porin